ncbi:bifunctional DNA primase/polymerase [Herbaspirillum sp.]|uniref:bifunctional DNA primase/polymerase n=1 Tax=Herbaspirillum sp. TaxID=1890675 RepID=UPI000C0ACFBE|nr:bifunctional DNA primase/polymerase [Herbaspirillum sp.]MAF06153.1 hypothetical protein [Herbaspirillum sp.]
MTINEYAREYVSRYGFQLVPIEPGRKFPTANDWGNQVLSDPDAAEVFYREHPDWNMGLALGPSRMCSLDIDCSESFGTVLDEFGIPRSALDHYPTIQGSAKGRRVMFRVPDGMALPYAKLNWPKRDAATLFTVFELRAACDGKQRQDVLPPSWHDQAQKNYEWLVKPPAAGQDFPPPPDWLLAIWEAWDKFKPQFKDACPWAVREQTPPPKPPREPRDHHGASVIDECLSREDLRATLQRLGYKPVGRRRFLSPHSNTGLPGVVMFDGDQSCWIHHASDPLCSEETGRPVNAFDLICQFEHGGDAGKAVKALADEYGIKRERVKSPQAAALEAPPPDMPPDDLPPAGSPDDADTSAPDDFPDTEPASAVEKTSMPFRALGFDGAMYYYLPRGTEQVCEIRRGSHTSPAEMLALAPVEWWDMAYPKDKSGTDWQAAASSCMRACEARGVYSLRNVRGRGAWYDGGNSVLHLGDRLIVNGEAKRIADHDTRFIYTRQGPMESTIDAPPADNNAANEVFKLFQQLNWSTPFHGWAMAGWTVLAPICGALGWRPHVWLTAQRGAGKSWVQENIIQPLLGQSALMVQGGTTEAGIRQHLKQDARPVIFDEAESEDHSAQKRMKSVIELARQSSSDGSAEIVKGTSGGGGMAFRMRSMFLLGSVNVSLSQAADESRFTVVSLKQPDKTAAEIARFNEFVLHVGNTLTPERCAAIRARSYHLIPVIRKNAKTLAQAVAETLGSQRIGDQVGTLLAGAVSLSMDREISIEEARVWTSKINLDEAKESEEVSDEGMCLNAILQTQLTFDAAGHRYQRTVSEIIMAAGGRKAISGDVYADDCNAVLSRHGLFVDGGLLVISNTHNELKRMLRDTPWAAGWRRVLSRLPGADVCPAPQRFAGSQTRAIRVPLDSFL